MTPPLTGSERVKRHREKKRTAQLFSDVRSTIQKELAEDLCFTLKGNDLGDYRVDWDMPKRTDAFLRGYAASKGLTLADLLESFSQFIIRSHKADPSVIHRAAAIRNRRVEKGVADGS